MSGWLVSPMIPETMVVFCFGRRELSRLLANSQTMDAPCTLLPTAAAGKVCGIAGLASQMLRPRFKSRKFLRKSLVFLRIRQESAFLALSASQLKNSQSLAGRAARTSIQPVARKNVLRQSMASVSRQNWRVKRNRQGNSWNVAARETFPRTVLCSAAFLTVRSIQVLPCRQLLNRPGLGRSNPKPSNGKWIIEPCRPRPVFRH